MQLLCVNSKKIFHYCSAPVESLELLKNVFRSHSQRLENYTFHCDVWPIGLLLLFLLLLSNRKCYSRGSEEFVPTMISCRLICVCVCVFFGQEILLNHKRYAAQIHNLHLAATQFSCALKFCRIFNFLWFSTFLW